MLNQIINSADEQSKGQAKGGQDSGHFEDLDEFEEDDEEPIIVRMLESMFSRKLEISQQLEMGMAIDVDELAHELKL